MTLESRVSARLGALLGPDDGRPVGVAVSGGGDSVALLHLMARVCGARRLMVASVDHGLRPGSADEARGVAEMARGLGLSHTVLRWHDWDGQGNLQDAARLARQRLLAGWARDQGIAAICLGHTRDDQAETVLMRLARGSGVDGLAGMAPCRRGPEGLRWLRPVLTERRDDLRGWLRAAGIGWIDDPSNEDPRFDRVRARKLLSALGDLGVSVNGVADTAERMAAARAVLTRQAAAAAAELAEVTAGALTLTTAVWDLPDDTRWRVLSGALCQVSGTFYRPALKALRAAEVALGAGRAHTLHGCLMLADHRGVRVQREPNALRDLRAPYPGLWANWQVSGPPAEGAEIAAIGVEGLSQRPNWRNAGLPRDLAITTPGVWDGARLLAAPGLESGPWQANLTWDKATFTALLISH